MSGRQAAGKGYERGDAALTQNLGRESKAKKKTSFKGIVLTEWEDARGIRGQAIGKGVASERRASGGRGASEWRASGRGGRCERAGGGECGRERANERAAKKNETSERLPLARERDPSLV